MIIDMHAHICDMRSPNNMACAPLTAENLVERLDADGIDKAAVLPWAVCPEGVTFQMLFAPEQDVVGQIRAAARHPDRLILFGNADPRWGGNLPDTDFSWLLERFVEMGCVGMGEVSANIYFDDPRTINLFRQCGKWKLPVTIESTGPGSGGYGFIDDVGSPRFERLLRAAPDTIIIGHGPGFWAEIAGGLTPEAKSGYPAGPVSEEGSIQRLFRTYPNLYADISARSGYNALTRDSEYGVRFIDEFQDRLLFATDVCYADADELARTGQLALMKRLLAEGGIAQAVFDKITCKNALRLLRRYGRAYT
ncbi:MAG: hypothetical protein CVU38_15290 [Chloroflexi bacterium HGW-Chloroflexi-1]|nr:MAG: hypothetical protein CVU38_15290 [Chloroflexi bacterium HGW-Chloroflexi-1]